MIALRLLWTNAILFSEATSQTAVEQSYGKRIRHFRPRLFRATEADCGRRALREPAIRGESLNSETPMGSKLTALLLALVRRPNEIGEQLDDGTLGPFIVQLSTDLPIIHREGM